MTILIFTIVLWLVSAIAGFLGALTGLGGGVIIVPLLTLAFGVDIRYAIGASLVSVIATSSGAAAAYVREGYTNIRIGMFLEIATTLGAIVGALIAVYMPTKVIGLIFGAVLIYSAYLSSRPHPLVTTGGQPDKYAAALKLNGSMPTITQGDLAYEVYRVPTGFAVMLGAGALSGLLGIGSGALKVLGMDQVMKIPFKVSTTTSNFMIGVTAAASAGIYLKRGYIEPGLAMPVMLGVLLGSMLGAKVLMRVKTKTLRNVFAFVIVVMGLEMIFNALTGRI